MKRVFIVHGWGGNPDEAWLTWLKNECEKAGYSTIIPKMPDTDCPKIRPWVSHLKKTVGKIDNETFFVGHSIGCQTILRTVKGKAIGGMVLVAPWVTLTNIAPEEQPIAQPWLKGSLSKIHGPAVAVFSDNDPYVPLENAKVFRKLGCKVIVQKKKGHFASRDDHINTIPVVRKELLRMMQ